MGIEILVDLTLSSRTKKTRFPDSAAIAMHIGTPIYADFN
jgi:hypothetical protein